MNPCYFGYTNSPLFGVYSAPRVSQTRDAAVLICSPIAQEYMRTHWAIRQLSYQLSDAGFHVLRFDYSGVGDSALDENTINVDLWLENIQLAAQELRDISGAKRLIIVGLRMGSILAAEAQSKKAIDADQLILWDPVVQGKSYLQQLEALTNEIALDRTATPKKTDYLLGFQFSEKLRKDIQELDLNRTLPVLVKKPVSIIVSDEHPDFTSLKNNIQNLDYSCVPDAGNWDSLSHAHNALLSTKIIQAIVQKAGTVQ